MITHVFLNFIHIFFVVKDLKTHQELLWGPIKDGPYCLHSRDILVARPQVLLSITNSSILWHLRLGHPSFPIVSHALYSSIILNKDHVGHVCSACQLGKIVNHSFLLTMNKSIELFKLIHTDIWGPAPVLFRSGHRYYIHFVEIIANTPDTLC